MLSNITKIENSIDCCPLKQRVIIIFAESLMQTGFFLKHFGDCILAAKYEPHLTNTACSIMDTLLKSFITSAGNEIPTSENFESLADSNNKKIQKAEEVLNALDFNSLTYDKKRETVGAKTLIMLIKIVNDPSKKEEFVQDFSNFMVKLGV